MQRFEQMPRPCCCRSLAPRRGAPGALHRAKDPSVRLEAASGLAATRRAECAGVSLFWYFVIRSVANCCRCCCSGSVRVRTARSENNGMYQTNVRQCNNFPVLCSVDKYQVRWSLFNSNHNVRFMSSGRERHIYIDKNISYVPARK